MTEQSDENRPDTWADATDRFVVDAGDALGDAYAPQIKALRSLADELDNAEHYSAPLAAEYARMHRWLLNKLGGGKAEPDPGGGPDLLDMLASNPGAFWKP